MGIEQIVARIIDEARDRAAALRTDVDRKVDAMTGRWAEERAILEREAVEATTVATTKERERLLTTEKLETRKRRLALRREVVEKAFQKARAAFLDLPRDTYEALLVDLVANGSLTGDEEVVLGERDHARLGAAIVKKSNEHLTTKGRNGQLKLSSAPGDLDAGAILRRDRVQVRRTLDDLLAEIRERVEGRVAAALFEDHA